MMTAKKARIYSDESQASGMVEAIPVPQYSYSRPALARPRLSVIIPTLNEEVALRATLESLDAGHDEVIVADGGSRDRTTHVARAFGARVIVAPCGRASQMNAGASIAVGEYLLFLHADTLVPLDYGALIHQTIDRGATGGAFGFAINAPEFTYRMIEIGVRFRCHVLGLPYGDQAFFLTRRTFEEIGGFPKRKIMEDFDFARRIRRIGRFDLLDARIRTSVRRWKRVGALRVVLLNQAIVLGHLLGVPTETLAKWYGAF